MTSLWKICHGERHIASLNETAWRMIEAQEMPSTRKLVDSHEEQEILEQLIEETKPVIPQPHINLHPLLLTPFRYPPLKYGSRFGHRFEDALWYGSLDIETAMAEVAFYRLNFLRASKASLKDIRPLFTAFSTQVTTQKGLYLTQPPFSEHRALISSPICYQASQTLGKSMRDAGVQAFCYYSARTKDTKNNIALFTPKAFPQKKPNRLSLQTWQCIANQEGIEFIRLSTMSVESRQFPLESFLVEKELPFPAN